jgi:acyl-CoA thioester hydrolase
LPARTQEKMNEQKIFAGDYTVRVGDINYGGHMGNDKALLLFHDARIHFLERIGFSEGDIGGPGIIMAEAHVYFKKELFRGDELKLYVHIEELRGVAFELHYTVMRGEDKVIYGSTKLISFDYELRKVVKLPDAFVEAISFS